MKKIFYILNFLMLLSISYGYAQTQVGQTLVGRNFDSKFGSGTAISADGNRIIVGARTDGLYSNVTGYVEVFDWNGTSWDQVGVTLQGEDYISSQFGIDVDISNDGNRIMVIAAIDIFIFDWNGTSWVQTGIIASTPLNYPWSGAALSGDGNSIVYGHEDINNQTAELKVFEQSGSSWLQKGNTINGIFPNTFYSNAVSINEDGSIIAVGSKNQNFIGEAYVFEWNGSIWNQLGNELSSYITTSYNNSFGESVELNDSGDRIVISSNSHCLVLHYQNGMWNQLGSIPTSLQGAIKTVCISGEGNTLGLGIFGFPGNVDENIIYHFSNNNWIKFGNNILGDEYQDAFYNEISLNYNGSRLISGAKRDIAGNGYVKVFETANCSWEKQNNLQVNGESSSDQFGTAMKYTPDGNFLIAGTAYGDGNGSNSGEVRIFEKSGNTWNQRGATLLGEAAGDRFGGAVAISDNGKYAIVGARFNDGGGQNAGHVRMFKWNGTNYIPYGNDIDGTSNFDYTGYTVDISNSGKYFAVGSPFNDDAGSNRGKIQLYKRSSTNHILVGPPIYGSANYDYLGRSFCLSGFGTKIAVGSMYNDVSGSNSGQVTVYAYFSQFNSWLPLGNSINGNNAGDYFGHSVSFSANDQDLAIGAYGSDPNGNTSGQVKVYSLSGYNWIQKGNTLDGQNAGDYFGISTALSASGDRLVVGAPYSDLNGNASGHITVFDYDNGSWTQSGDVVNGDNSGDYFGVSVSIRDNGTSIAVGARGDDNGGNYSGSVQIIETCPSNTKSLNQNSISRQEEETSIEESEVRIGVSVYPNPTPGLLEIVGITAESMDVEFFNNAGMLVFSQTITGNSLDISELTTGIYHLKVLANDKVYNMKVVKK